MPNKTKLLKMVLWIGAAYYLVGAFVHYFAVTLFPWYEANLYTPYHDSVIALCSLMFALFLAAIARDPAKNTDTLKVVVIGAFIASVFSVAIIWKVDFASLGAPAKELQTIIEGILGFIFTGAVLWLYPKS